MRSVRRSKCFVACPWLAKLVSRICYNPSKYSLFAAGKEEENQSFADRNAVLCAELVLYRYG